MLKLWNEKFKIRAQSIELWQRKSLFYTNRFILTLVYKKMWSDAYKGSKGVVSQ